MDIKTPHITASGNLTWYEYDNFTIDWTIDLEKDGEPLEFKTGDLIIINFYDEYKNHIAEIKQTPTNGLITVTFDSELLLLSPQIKRLLLKHVIKRKYFCGN